MFTKLRRRGTIWPQCVPVYDQLFIANTYKVIQNRTHLGKIVLRRISFVNTICWPYKETHLVLKKLRRCGTIWPQCVLVYEQLFVVNTWKVLQNRTHWGQIVPRRISLVNTICRPHKETHLLFTKLRRRGTIWPQCVPVYEQLFIANTYKAVSYTHLTLPTKRIV